MNGFLGIIVLWPDWGACYLFFAEQVTAGIILTVRCFIRQRVTVVQPNQPWRCLFRRYMGSIGRAAYGQIPLSTHKKVSLGCAILTAPSSR